MGEQEQSNWSISLGRWNGVNLRLHCFFLLFAVCTLYLAWNAEQKGENDSFISIAAVSLGVLLVSGLLHELGHLQAAIRLGGQMDQIILAPFVGIAPPRVRSDAHAEFVCHAAGPLINLLVCLVCAPLLWSQSGGEWWTWLHPLQPAGPVEMQNVAAIVPLVFWINWVMLLLNLLPVFPFDGGRMLRAAILIAWPKTNPRLAAQIVAGAAKLAAFSLAIVAAFLMWSQGSEYLVPPWFALILLAIFVYFGAKQEVHPETVELDEDLEYGWDGFPSDLDEHDELDDSSSEKSVGMLTHWLREREQRKLERQRSVEAEEEQRVDGILARVHEHGMQSLSNEERELLARVSARYRNRISN